jgi:hypothetical protein
VDELTAIAFVALLAVALAVAVLREDGALRRRARRYRELELEGIEQLRYRDPYPESSPEQGRWLRAPDGAPVDAGKVLYEELERARAHTRRVHRQRSRDMTVRNGKGAAWLL